MTYPFALLFDLDGTLAETAPDLCAAMNYVMAENGLKQIPTEAMRDIIGGGARMILQRGLKFNNVTWEDDRLDTATEKLVTYYDAHIAEHTYLYDGVQECLMAAKAQNIGCAVVTNKRRALAIHLLAELGVAHFFDIVVGGDTMRTRKPDPEMLYEAAAKLAVPPQKCIMIGDSQADTDAAKAAGMKSVCVTFGYRRGAAKELGATQLISHYSEIYTALTACLPELKLKYP